MKHDSPPSTQFKYHLFHSKTLVGSKLAEGMEFESYSLTGIDSNIMASAKRFYRTESDCRSKIHKLMLSLRFFLNKGTALLDIYWYISRSWQKQQLRATFFGPSTTKRQWRSRGISFLTKTLVRFYQSISYLTGNEGGMCVYMERGVDSIEYRENLPDEGDVKRVWNKTLWTLLLFCNILTT